MCASLWAQETAPASATPPPLGKIVAISAELHALQLDPTACYQARDISLAQPDVRFFFNDGWLIFAKPVVGHRIAAVYVATEAGEDGEVIVRPSTRGERDSMARATGAPNLDERFRLAVFLMTQGEGDELMRTMEERALRKSEERGVLLATRWGEMARNIVSSLEVRVAYDVLSNAPARKEGLFFAAVGGSKHGNFDIYVDPLNYEQVLVGKVNAESPKTNFDVWAAFRTRASLRASTPVPEELRLSNYRIEATVEANLHLNVVTRATMRSNQRLEGVVGLDISPRMNVTEIRIDGVSVEVFRRETLRESLKGGSRNETILAALPKPVERGQAVEIEVHHNGDVIAPAGPGVFFVADRVSWYPSRGYAFSGYDLKFRVPKQYKLAAPGDLVEERVDGDWRIVHRRSVEPIRIAGFNIGDYETVTATNGEYQVDMYANTSTEPFVGPKGPRSVIVSSNLGSLTRSSRSGAAGVLEVAPNQTPAATTRMKAVGQAMADEFAWMASKFGPPPLKRIAVAPIPGFFGQGFPGLIYLSTVAYLDDNQRRALLRSDLTADAFYAQLMHAHETAHQWWGNLIIPATYHDDWISEALANYTALLWIERQPGGPKIVELLLEDERRALLAQTPKGTVESTGPITWGARLRDESIQNPWRAITYGKGSWIVHMLRRRMGDDAFFRMLASLRKRYEYRVISTEEFRSLAAQFLAEKDPDPQLEAFFDTWVYGTGIPTYEVTTSVKGKAPNVTLTVTVRQSGVAKDFVAEVPVEIRTSSTAKPLVHWLHTSDEPAVLTVKLKAPPQRVDLAPRYGVLCRQK